MSLNFKYKNFWFLWISVLVFTSDYISKLLIKNYFTLNREIAHINIVGDLFRLKFVKNYGAAFSFKFTQNNQLNRYLFIVIIIAACLFIVYLLLTSQKRIQNIAYSLVLGGAFGNLYDRIFYGYVVDFLDFDFPDIIMNRWAIFNLADTFIVVAIFFLAVDTIFFKGAKNE